MSDKPTVIPVTKSKGIALAIISGRGQCPVDMIDAIAFQSWPVNTNYFMAKVYGQDTDQGRIDAVKQARALGAKYIWFVDDDTVPPQNAGRQLLYLLQQNGPPHGKVMIAAGVYTSRSSPPEALVFMGAGEGPDWNWKVGDTFKAWGAGTGCMMIDLSIFDHLPEPWFKTVTESTDRWSDDLYFCAIAAQAGFELMVHGGILCHHYDMERGIIYQLPRNSQPYKNRIRDAFEPLLPQMAVQSKTSYDLLPNPWMTETETIWLIEQAKKSKGFVEVGAWKGITTRNVAKNVPDCRVIAIDTFEGSEEHHNPHSPVYEPRLKNPDWLWNEARRNTQGLANVEIHKTTSLAAACGALQLPDLAFETVFIDASHEYPNVKTDIQAWLSLLSLDGVLCGHDYNWPGVKQAVDELLPGAINIPGTSIWMYRKAA